MAEMAVVGALAEGAAAIQQAIQQVGEMKEAPNPANDVYPLINKHGFFLNMLMIGEVSSGKSTVLNAILGDCLAPTDIDRSTLTAQRYYESTEAPSNESVFEKSGNINRVSDKKFNEDMKILADHQKKKRITRWVDQLRGRVPKPSFPKNTKSHEVAYSGLIPRTGKLDNTFNLLDLPGFNDPKLDDLVFEKLKNDCNQMDYIFYVVDCQNCFKKKSSQEYFDKVMDVIKDCLMHGFTKLVILFNKYDEVANKDHYKQFVQNQRDEIERKLTEQYGISKDKFKLFNISANNLLAQRILLYRDSNFLSKHIELMDAITEYAKYYLSYSDMNRIKMKHPDLEERLEAINDAIESEKMTQSLLRSEQDNVDESGEGQTPGGPGDSGQSEASNVLEEDLDGILEFLRGLRDITVLAGKAKNYLSGLKIRKYEELVKFFNCVFCLTQSFANKDDKDDWKITRYLRLNFEHMITEKLEEMFKWIGQEKNVANMNQCVHYSLSNLQYCLPYLDKKKFRFSDFIRFLTEHKYLTGANVQSLERSIDMSNDSSKKYFEKLGKCFVYTHVQQYRQKMGKQDTCTLDELLDFIFKYHSDVEKQSELLVSLLAYYPSLPKEQSHGSCGAAELVMYHFDMPRLRRLFVYDDYAKLCAKRVKATDGQFAKLILCLSKVSV